MSNLVEFAPVPDKGESHALAVHRFRQLMGTAVTTDEEYVAKADMLKQVKAGYKAVEDERLMIVKPINEGLRVVNLRYKTWGEGFLEVETEIKRQLIAYDEEQRKKREEEQRKLQAEIDRQRREAAQRAEEARRKAEEEAAEIRRKAKAEAAEKRRQAEAEAAEIRRKAEAEAAERRRKAEAAAAAGRAAEAARQREEAAKAEARAKQEAEEREAQAKIEAERLAQEAEQKAARREERGDERSEELTLTAATLVAPETAPARVAVKGLSRRTVWKFKIKDASKIPDMYKMVDEQKLAKLVKAMGKQAEELVPGIECYEEADLSSRRA